MHSFEKNLEEEWQQMTIERHKPSIVSKAQEGLELLEALKKKIKEIEFLYGIHHENSDEMLRIRAIEEKLNLYKHWK